MICTLAFLLLGFAHKPLVLETPIDEVGQSELYLLPDGTVPILCLQGHQNEGHPTHQRKVFCEACRLAGGSALPEPSRVLAPQWIEIRDPFASRGGEGWTRSGLAFAGSARGPPGMKFA